MVHVACSASAGDMDHDHRFALFVFSAGVPSICWPQGRREYVLIGLSPASLPDMPLWPADGRPANSRHGLTLFTGDADETMTMVESSLKMARCY
jgi:hypothetical protein